jgi:prepilin-type N-terminal cleavage/methylation domain-containing protein
MKKRAFTMIELVMVIIVLGVLSSIAITRLSVTKDDAEVVMLANAIKEGTKEFTTFVASLNQSLLDTNDTSSDLWDNSNVLNNLIEKNRAVSTRVSPDKLRLDILTSDHQYTEPCIRIEYYYNPSSKRELLVVEDIISSRDRDTILCQGVRSLVKSQTTTLRGVTLDL